MFVQRSHESLCGSRWRAGLWWQAAVRALQVVVPHGLSVKVAPCEFLCRLLGGTPKAPSAWGLKRGGRWFFSTPLCWWQLCGNHIGVFATCADLLFKRPLNCRNCYLLDPGSTNCWSSPKLFFPIFTDVRTVTTHVSVTLWEGLKRKKQTQHPSMIYVSLNLLYFFIFSDF